jgi:hypothetical protein
MRLENNKIIPLSIPTIAVIFRMIKVNNLEKDDFIFARSFSLKRLFTLKTKKHYSFQASP